MAAEVSNVIQTEWWLGTQNGESWKIEIIKEKVGEDGKPLYQEAMVTVSHELGNPTHFLTATNGMGTIAQMFRGSGEIF